MELKLVICKHCGFKFRIDIEALISDGTTTVVKGFLNFGKPKPRTVNPSTFSVLIAGKPLNTRWNHER